ncbi:MAG: hypothetical protein ACR2NX_05655 [Chthoniobacterales bacterium]
MAILRWWSLAVYSLASVWLIFCTGRTFARTFDWKEQRTFLERTMLAAAIPRGC